MTITSENEYGTSEPLTISITSLKFTYQSGVVVTMNELSAFECGNENNLTLPISQEITTIWDNIDGLDNELTAYSEWNKRMNNYLEKRNVKYFTFIMESYINMDTDDTVTFNYNQDYSTWIMYINNEEIINQKQFEPNKCKIWNINDSLKQVSLKKGYNNVKIIGNYSDYYCNNITCNYNPSYRFRLMWTTSLQQGPITIPFLQGIHHYSPLKNLKFDSQYYNFYSNSKKIQIPFSFDSGIPTSYSIYPEFPLPLEVDYNNKILIISKVSKMEKSTFVISFSNEFSVSNTFEITIEITGI